MNSSAGYTLLEVLIVMTILSAATLIGTSALPHLGERNGLLATDAELQSLLTEAHVLARRTGTIRQVTLDPAGRRVRSGPNGEWHQLDTRISLTVVSAQEVEVDGYPTILFLPDGTSSGAVVTLAAGGQRISRRVDWLSGRLQHVLN